MIFREDKSSFSLAAIPLESFQELYEGVWLILIGINEIPPHIGLLSEGKYYSLSTRKVDCGSSLERFLDVLSRKNIPTLFIHLDEKNKAGNNIIAGNKANSVNLVLENIYTDLQPLYNTENTCLSPIKEFFAKYYSSEFAGVTYVFELLGVADKKGLIKECLSFNTTMTVSNLITLAKYTMAQIRCKIAMLSTKSEISFLKS
jgi:hypothetical protein